MRAALTPAVAFGPAPGRKGPAGGGVLTLPGVSAWRRSIARTSACIDGNPAGGGVLLVHGVLAWCRSTTRIAGNGGGPAGGAVLTLHGVSTRGRIAAATSVRIHDGPTGDSGLLVHGVLAWCRSITPIAGHGGCPAGGGVLTLHGVSASRWSATATSGRIGGCLTRGCKMQGSRLDHNDHLRYPKD